MVQFSSLLIATTACLFAEAAYSTPGLVMSSRRHRPTRPYGPDLGEELTLWETYNNMDEGTFNTSERAITFRVLKRIAVGSIGRVYGIDCRNIACNELGPVVLKHYYSNIGPDIERNNLARIGELKAVGSIDGDEYTLMTQWNGVYFTELPTYLRLSQSPQENFDALVDFVNSAFLMTARDAEEHLINHHILHGDINEYNILFQESEGKIISAKLVDWEDSRIISTRKVYLTLLFPYFLERTPSYILYS
ncbi:hypothetical protein CTA2_11076 [Colletotrichum tanaceti]|uniref:Protein kinase domain-containing protein n=1 Tax=Colletotrichum tanaceti TaxID=1306861 RepID=A0A4U6XN42_9PEZI|nr:hypothetical protein CTA2_11076 [Colletotrichum tanaceti]TKW57118.1 hypothetical protein CTA1_7974 [Colletotrichum tanaceti]